MKSYKVLRASAPPASNAAFGDSPWDGAPAQEIAEFLAIASDYRPRTRFKCLWDDTRLYGVFQVQDRYVRRVKTDFQSHVCDDSCVECFIRPDPNGPTERAGYFNFEFNCGGVWKCRYTTIDAADNALSTTPLDMEDFRQTSVVGSLPGIIDPEIAEETDWWLTFAIPFAVLTRYSGAPAPKTGDRWRANFYKCGNKVSHPHFGCWNLVGRPNFHTPSDFGELVFA